MTVDRNLKRVARARAEKTGESYQTARMRVVEALPSVFAKRPEATVDEVAQQTIAISPPRKGT